MTKLAYVASCLGFALLAGCSEDSTGTGGGGGDPPDPNAACPRDGDNAGPPISATFAPPIFFPIDVEPAHMVSGDFNDDGHVDIAVSEGLKSDAVVVFPGDGTGALGVYWLSVKWTGGWVDEQRAEGWSEGSGEATRRGRRGPVLGACDGTRGPARACDRVRPRSRSRGRAACRAG